MNALLNVINAELFKTLRKRRVYVLSALQWFLLPIIILIVGYVIQINVTDTFVDEGGIATSAVQEVASPFGIARLSLFLPAAPAVVFLPFYIIIIALLAALLIGEERSQNMWKTTLVAQPNRLAVLFGKFFVAFIIFGIVMLGSLVFSVVLGGIGTLFLETTFAGDWGQLVLLYVLQWLFGSAAIFFAFLMFWLIRNIALAMVSIFFLPSLLEALYSLVRTALSFERLTQLNALFQTLRLRRSFEELPRYFFTNNLYSPARRPLNDIVTTLGGNTTNNNDASEFFNNLLSNFSLAHSARVMAVYAVVLGGLMVWRFLRRDVS